MISNVGPSSITGPRAGHSIAHLSINILSYYTTSYDQGVAVLHSACNDEWESIIRGIREPGIGYLLAPRKRKMLI